MACRLFPFLFLIQILLMSFRWTIPAISFIYDSLSMINKVLNDSGSSVYIVKGNPINVWELLTSTFDINKVYTNKDYEPYAIRRDESVSLILKKKNIEFLLSGGSGYFRGKGIIKIRSETLYNFHTI